LGIAAIAVLFGPARPASATPITYTFSNASAVFGGVTETITGGFTFDIATGYESDVFITLTGQSGVSTYTETLMGYVGNTNEISAAGVNGALTIYFAGPLSSATDNLQLVGQGATAFGPVSSFASSPAGSVTSAVPEPSAVMLLSAGLLGLGLLRRNRRLTA